MGRWFRSLPGNWPADAAKFFRERRRNRKVIRAGYRVGPAGVHIPGITARHATRSSICRCFVEQRVCDWRTTVIVMVVPVQAPFIDVAVQIEQREGNRSPQTNCGRAWSPLPIAFRICVTSFMGHTIQPISSHGSAARQVPSPYEYSQPTPRRRLPTSTTDASRVGRESELFWQNWPRRM